jgi:hypothetical protein
MGLKEQIEFGEMPTTEKSHVYVGLSERKEEG